MGALAFRVLSTDRDTRLQALLPVIAIGVATMLLLLTLGASLGFDRRAERTAWRNLDAAGDPAAVVAIRTDYVDSRLITIVDYAPVTDDAPVPPGLDRAPRPGELWVSPALDEALADLPADELADRFGTAPSGRIDRRSLLHPGELLAIVGHAPDAAVLSGARPAPPIVNDTRTVPPTGIAAWSTAVDGYAETYIVLARIGAMLMIVPLLALGGSASRLLAARRNRRLSLLRLIGGSVGRVVGLTAAEAAVLGAAGALAGGIGYLALLPWCARLPMAGGAWFVSDIWVGPLWFLATLGGVIALVTMSAVISLWPVVRRPFATARAQRPGVARMWRVLALVAATAVFWRNAAEGWRNVAVPLALVLAAFMVVGPWVIRLAGVVMARTSRRAPALLAGRRLVEDPRSGWRAVAGMVLAAFIAAYLAVAVPTDLSGTLGSSADQLAVVVPGQRDEALAEQARQRLRAAGVPADVTLDAAPPWASERDRTLRATPADSDDLDRARTALSGLVPGSVAVTPADETHLELLMLDDVRVGGLVVLVAAFLVAAVSAGVGGIGRVLDQQGPLTLVRLAGAPVSVLAAARRREVIAPLVLCGGGAAAFGTVLGFLTLGGTFAVVDNRWIALFAGLVVAGFVAVVGADVLSRSVLARVTADLSERE